MKEKKLDQYHKKYTVFWDGDCAFCCRCATWVKEKTPPTVELVPYQNAPNPPIDANLASECGKALHLQLPNGNFERGGKACVSILELIGYRITGRIFKTRFLNWIPETIYYLVARNRKILSFFFLNNF